MTEYDRIVRADYERELGADPKNWYLESCRRFDPAMTVFSPGLGRHTVVPNPDYMHDCRSCGQHFAPDRQCRCSACGASRLLPLDRTVAG